MAIIQVGPVVSDIRGSINGVTFGRNRAGLFARQRVVPVDPATPDQVTARTRFAAGATAWRGLGFFQQKSWNDRAALTPFINSLGETFFLSGFQLFMRTDVLRAIAGGTRVASAPTQPIVQLGTLTLAYTALAGIELTAVVDTEVANGDAIWQQSIDISTSISFYKGPFNEFKVNAVEDFAALPVLLIPIASLVADRRYFIRARVIQDDGSATAPSIYFVDTPDPL